jgi:Ca2+-binding EF-hand superfamily protein
MIDAAILRLQEEQMKTRRLFICLLVLAAIWGCLSGPAFAQQTPVKPDWREGFKAHDKNQDGKIDRAEFQEWVVDVFFLRDTGHKGYLAFADVQGVMSAEKFKTFDRNGDGRLRLREYLNALFQDFAAIDVNQDGAITMEEIETYIRIASK